MVEGTVSNGCQYFDLFAYEYSESTNTTESDINATYPSFVMDYSTTAYSRNITEYSALDDVKFYLTGVISPVFCICGIIGNVFNILVLTRRRMQESMDCTMEKAAQTGLVALAASDLLYCLTTLLKAFLVKPQVIYTSKNIWLYVSLYGHYIQNIFMYTSTWLTVIMAAGRYAAICRPLHARYLVGVKATRIAVLSTFVFWVFFQLPTIWNYYVQEVSCRGRTKYIMDQGIFSTNTNLRLTFSYLWAIIGYFIPVVILAFCNVHLIKALHESKQMRKLYRVSVSQKSAASGSRITPTLVAIVCMFLLLVSPSEILQFFHYTVPPKNVEAFTFALVFSNVLLTANLAFNFVLYCIVNVHFRETLREVVFCLVRREYYGPLRRRKNSANASTKGSFLAHSTVESIV